jgi:FAD dependent oxidoreductase TIGR03364
VTDDPRQGVGELPAWLARTWGVEFVLGTTVLGYDRPRVVTSAGDWTAEQMLVCTGADFRELAAQAFAASGLVPCKLQMMRSEPSGDRIGTLLAGGLTLRHYRAFAGCPGLPELSRRFDAELPEYGRYGIHVLVSQNGLGELVIGDSHEYGEAVEPFDKPQIDELILAYLRTFLAVPDLRIAARWHGVYVKHPTDAFVIAEAGPPGMLAVTGLGGAGMTLSFGLAEEVVGSGMGGNND